MPTERLSRLAIRLCFVSNAALLAAEFAFTDFSSGRGLSLVQDARRSSKVLRLTPSRPNRVGAAWFRVKQPIVDGFETTFQFQLTHQDTRGYRGADGLAFVVQDSGPAAIGGRGSAGGFASTDGNWNPPVPGIPGAIAVFFDTYENPEDPSGNYAVICGIGAVPDMRYPPRRLALRRALDVDLKDGKVHTVKIAYEPPTISVFLDRAVEPVLAAAINISGAIDANGSAYVGLTAATGGGYQNHDVLKWSFRGLRPDVSSNMSVVSSRIDFLKSACLPERTLCTPDRVGIEETGPGQYHIVLPANLEWGASVPNPAAGSVTISNATGMVCWEQPGRGSQGCNGPSGNGAAPNSGQGFLAPDRQAGVLIMKTQNGHQYFSVNDRSGDAFHDNEGYFAFDVDISGPR